MKRKKIKLIVFQGHSVLSGFHAGAQNNASSVAGNLKYWRDGWGSSAVLGNIYPLLRVCHVKQCLHYCLEFITLIMPGQRAQSSAGQAHFLRD